MPTFEKAGLWAEQRSATPAFDGHSSRPPYSSVADWAAINRGFSYLMRKAGRRLTPARQTAFEIENDLTLLGAMFDELADATCGRCVRPCCHAARVWLDFKDLLFLHLSDQPLPVHQLRRDMEESCRFLAPTGCRLPRLSRPWVCTWYVCPTQRNALARDLVMGDLRCARLQRDVGRMRARMEDQFLRAVHPKYAAGDMRGP